MNHGPNYGGDLTAATELMNFIDNDADLYRQQYLPIIKNMARRIRKGTYSVPLGVKLVGYLVESGAKKYAKEFGTPGVPWHKQFDTQTRHLAATHMESNYRTMIRDGEYDDYLAREGIDMAKKNPLKKNPSRRARTRMETLGLPFRDPTQDDLNAAARGLKMVGMSYAELSELMESNRHKPIFANQVIYMAAKQIRDSKARVGLIRKNPKKKRRFSAKQIAAQKRFANMARMRARKNPKHRGIVAYRKSVLGRKTTRAQRKRAADFAIRTSAKMGVPLSPSYARRVREALIRNRSGSVRKNPRRMNPRINLASTLLCFHRRDGRDWYLHKNNVQFTTERKNAYRFARESTAIARAKQLMFFARSKGFVRVSTVKA